MLYYYWIGNILSSLIYVLSYKGLDIVCELKKILKLDVGVLEKTILRCLRF